MPNTLTREGLEAIGQALFGQQWQRELARAISVGDRTMRRYLAGQLPIPDWLPAGLRKLAKDRSAAIKAAIAEHLGPER